MSEEIQGTVEAQAETEQELTGVEQPIDSPTTEEISDSTEISEPSQEDVDQNAGTQQEEDAPPSVKKRLNKFYAEKRAAEERAKKFEAEAYAYRQELAKAQQQVGGDTRPLSTGLPPEPDEEDPKYAHNQKAYVKDLIAYEKSKMVFEAQQQSVHQYYTNLNNSYLQKIEDARSRYGDFDESIESLPIPQGNPMVSEVTLAIQELDNSADVAYWFSKNPQKFTKLFNMHSRAMALEIGKISAEVANKSSSQTASRPNSPPPPKNIRSNVTAKTKSMIDMSVSDLAKALRSRR